MRADRYRVCPAGRNNTMSEKLQKTTFDVLLKKKVLEKPETGVFLPLILLLIVIGFVNKNFFAVSNVIDILRSTSYTFIVAAPLTLLMICTGMDLSIGAATALGGVVCGWGLAVLHWAILPSILLGLFSGFIVGLVKSFLVVTFDLPAFIITLGLTKIIDSFILVTTGGVAVSGLKNEAFKVLGQGKVFGKVHWTILIALMIGILMHVILVYTKFGRSLCAIGGNKETAKLAGIKVVKTRFLIETTVSVFCAFCGICMCSRFNSGQTAAGEGTELTIMAAVIIGGTSMFGGTGSILGSFLGCLLLAVINNGLVLMHVSTNWQNMIFGLILVISLFIDKYRRSKNSGTV
jgi:Ribose/xylose/arabinose/galactoside ABC-type transport systems, permease components